MAKEKMIIGALMFATVGFAATAPAQTLSPRTSPAAPSSGALSERTLRFCPNQTFVRALTDFRVHPPTITAR